MHTEWPYVKVLVRFSGNSFATEKGSCNDKFIVSSVHGLHVIYIYICMYIFFFFLFSFLLLSLGYYDYFHHFIRVYIQDSRCSRRNHSRGFTIIFFFFSIFTSIKRLGQTSLSRVNCFSCPLPPAPFFLFLAPASPFYFSLFPHHLSDNTIQYTKD